MSTYIVTIFKEKATPEHEPIEHILHIKMPTKKLHKLHFTKSTTAVGWLRNAAKIPGIRHSDSTFICDGSTNEDTWLDIATNVRFFAEEDHTLVLEGSDINLIFYFTNANEKQQYISKHIRKANIP